MAPRNGYQNACYSGYDVYDHCKTPGYDDIGCRPKEPRLNVSVHIVSVTGRVGFKPKEVDEQGRSHQDSGEEDRANQGGEQGGEQAASVMRLGRFFAYEKQTNRQKVQRLALRFTPIC